MKLSPVEFELFWRYLPVWLFGLGTFPDSPPSILNFVFPARILALLALGFASSIMAEYSVPLSTPTPSFLSLAFYSIGANLVPTAIGNFWWLSFFFHNGPFPFCFCFLEGCLCVFLTFNWFSFSHSFCQQRFFTLFQYVDVIDFHKKFFFLVSSFSFIFIFIKKKSSLIIFFLLLLTALTVFYQMTL